MTYRKIFPLFLIMFLSSFGVFAGDCDFVDSDKVKNVPPAYSIVFPQKVYDRVLINLMTYCCDKYSDKMGVCKSAKVVEDYASSEFLYDHLVDVAFRRLDGHDGNYSYNLEPDGMGSGRRKFIVKSSESVTGDIASRVGKEYDKYWTLRWYEYNSGFFLNYNNIEEVSLVDKYYFICDVARDLLNEVMLSRYKLNDDYYKKCRELVYKRINNEDLYVRSVMISSSNQILKSVFNAYMFDYFVQEKLSAFKEKMVEFVNLFYTIFKQAPVAKSCSR